MPIYRVSWLQANGLPGGLIGLQARPPVLTLPFVLTVAGPVPFAFDGPLQGCQETNDSIQLAVTVVDEGGLPISLRNASALTLALRAPDGTVADKAASLLTNGLDGGLQYTTTKADLTQAGVYQLQAEYVIGGLVQTTRWGRFRVGANLDDN